MTYTASDGASSGTTTFTVVSRICSERIWYDEEFSCDLDDRHGSADFSGECTLRPERFEDVEVPCT